jgi:hypothetical protein
MRQAITGEDKFQAEVDNMNNGKTIIYEIIEQLERLSEQQQKQILEYVKAMLQEAPQGTPMAQWSRRKPLLQKDGFCRRGFRPEPRLR